MANFSVFTTRRGLPKGRGGLYALSWPLLVILLALMTMRRPVSELSDPSGPALGGLFFLIAAPTTWLFALLRLSSTVSVVLGIVTSLPLWYRLGSSLAEGTMSWATWWRRYAMSVVASMVLVMLLVALVALVAQ